MERQQGYYSLVQFCPDPARAESANIGVLLFSPADRFIDVKLSNSSRRVSTFFRQCGLDTDQVKSTHRWLKDRLEVERDRFQTLDDLNQFIGTRFNDVRLTEPRSIAVKDPARQLEALYAELVETPSKTKTLAEPLQSTSPTFKRLDEFFHRPDIARFVQFNQKVTVPVLVETLDIPFVFTNGSVSLVRPQRIASLDAAKKWVTDGHLLAKHPGPDGKRRELFLVAETPSARLQNQVSELSSEVEKLGVRFFPQPEPLMALLEEKAVA